MGLSSSNSSEQNSKLKILSGVDIAVTSPEAVWRSNAAFFGGLQSFFLEAFT